MALNKRIFYLFCFFWILIGSMASGQTSNKGTDFWVAYAGHRDGTGSRLTLFLTAESNAVVNINAGGTALPAVNLQANQAKAVTIDGNIYTNTYVGLSDGISSNSGIHVTSDVPIIVYSHISRSARSAATLIFPTKALGNEYYAVSYNQLSGQYSEFTIVGTEDNTLVEITPSQNSVNDTRSAGVPFTVSLNKGDIYQFQSKTDITGSKIKTVGGCKPLAVFSGSTFTAYCEDGSTGGTGDNLYQQLLPVSAWGKNFVTAPFYNTVNGSTDIYRIITAENNTTVKVNGSVTNANGTPLNNPYPKGSIIEFTSQGSNVIEADGPVCLAQYQTTQSCNPNNNPGKKFPGDPEMTIINPVEQTLNDITVYSAISTAQASTNITSHFINVIIKTSYQSSLKIDGALPKGSFISIDSEYSYLIENVTASSAGNPTHRITADGGFSAIAYGYGDPESYAYLAGADLKNLNQFIEPERPAASLAVQEGCINELYNFKLRLPYETSSIRWDLGNGIVDIDNSPTPDIITTGSTILYEYQYSGNPALYASPGIYIVKADVINPSPSGCDANETVQFDFTVHPLPEAKFTLDETSVCSGSAVTFTDNSTAGGSNTIKKWIWDFGDGSAAEIRTSGDPFPHNFTTHGDFNVTLTVETANGCQQAAPAQQIHIYQLPQAEFTYSSPACENGSITFTSTGTTGEGTIINYAWDFGDGSPLIEGADKNTVSHSFSYNGNTPYQVKLTIESSFGCTDVKTIPVFINMKPVADFIMPDFCLADGTARFINTSTIADGTENQMTYLWDFGDGSTSTDKDASHVYTNIGHYQITLKAVSAKGCESAAVKAFTVNGGTPQAGFKVINETNLCSGKPVIFEDLSAVNFGEITKIEWDFDIGNPDPSSKAIFDPRQRSSRQYSYLYPVNHIPSGKTVYVKMRVYSGNTCFEETLQYAVHLKGIPEVKLEPVDPVCIETPPFRLTQASEIHSFEGTGNYSGPGVTADGMFDSSLAGSGTHTITYIFNADNGCSDQKSQVVTVYPAPAVEAGSSQTILEGGQVPLHASASGSGLTYKWSPSIGLDHNDIPNPIASPEEDIEYILTVTSNVGCTASDKIFIKVLKMPKIPNAFTPNGDGNNDKWNIEYLDSYPGAVVTIVNRYGRQVFRSLGYASPWDGRQNGNDLPSGNYYYVIDPKNGRKPITGYVSIIR